MTSLVGQTGERQVIKSKSMATQEIGLDAALAQQGITVTETDLAELIVQLGHDRPSHIVVPAIHKNRAEIREIFLREMHDAPSDLTDDPRALAEASRRHLRRKFFEAKVAVTGANFAVAETGSLVIAESEGNARMCLTLPQTLISVVGIEKLVPTFRDLEVFLQLLPRSSTGERMNPYNSVWTGVTPGDGPQQVHIVLLDNGRTNVLRDELGRQALRCIRCAACLNVCPVYERAGGHAYGATYPGPIGAVLTPQLVGVEHASTLPFASSLCGYCYEVCPVKIDIPSVLVKLRHDSVKAKKHPAEDALFAAAASAMKGRRRWTAALKLAPLMRLLRRGGPPPVSQWTSVRDLPEPPARSFRDWWVKEHAHQRKGRPRMSAREEILARVRGAIAAADGGAPASEVPRRYRTRVRRGYRHVHGSPWSLRRRGGTGRPTRARRHGSGRTRRARRAANSRAGRGARGLARGTRAAARRSAARRPRPRPVRWPGEHLRGGDRRDRHDRAGRRRRHGPADPLARARLSLVRCPRGADRRVGP